MSLLPKVTPCLWEFDLLLACLYKLDESHEKVARRSMRNIKARSGSWGSLYTRCEIKEACSSSWCWCHHYSISLLGLCSLYKQTCGVHSIMAKHLTHLGLPCLCLLKSSLVQPNSTPTNWAQIHTHLAETIHCFLG